MVQRVRALIAAARAEPTAWRSAGRGGDCLAYLAYHRSLLFGRVLIHTQVIGHAVTEPLPLAFIAFFDDRRMMRAHVGIEQHRRTNAVLVEHFHHAKHADARAVVTQRIAGYVGELRARRAGDDFVDMKKFDIWRNHQGDARALRPLKWPAANDRGIIVAVGLHVYAS